MGKDKQTVLVVYNYNRHDFLKYLEQSKNDIKFYFAEFTSPLEEKNKVYKTYGEAIYWGDYTDVFQLLDTIKPAKVLFHYIESNFHIILNIACALRSIPTYIIDHGIRDVNINIRLRAYLKPVAGKNIFKRCLTLGTQFLPRLKARLYYNRSLVLLSKKYNINLNSILQYKNLNKSNKFKEPTTYIVISKKTFEYHKAQNNIPDDKPYYIIGLPAFDGLAHTKPASVTQKNIIFIDQGLATVGLFGWTANKYKQFQNELIMICRARGYDLFIKPHPRQPEITWGFFVKEKHLKIINDDELVKLLPQTPIILGFISTYLLPLASLSHTTLITFENHPIGKLDVSKSFTDAGVAHPVYELQELNKALDNIEQLHQQQLPNKSRFTEDWLYKFDGKSGERLRDILLNE